MPIVSAGRFPASLRLGGKLEKLMRTAPRRSRRLAGELHQSVLESGLLKVPIGRQGLAQSALAHQDE